MKRYVKKVWILVCSAGLYALFPFLYLVDFIRPVRIVHFGVDRIGHLAEDIHIHLGMRALSTAAKQPWQLLIGGNPTNRQLLKLWKRILPINDNYLVASWWYAVKDILARTRFHQDTLHDLQRYAELNAVVPPFRFTDDEARRGAQLLVAMNIREGAWYGCIYCRDAAYAIERAAGERPFEQLKREQEIWDYDLAAFYPAAKRIAGAGGKVVRVGSVSNQVVPSELEGTIVDYTSHYQSDSGDIYIAANCRFFIGTMGGLVWVYVAFDKPVGVVSALAFPPELRSRDYFIPSLIRETRTGRFLTFREMQELGMFRIASSETWISMDQFRKHGLAPVPSSEADIDELCMDMLDSLSGRPPPHEAVEIQEQYRETFTSHLQNYRLAPRIGPRFCLRYKDLILSS